VVTSVLVAGEVIFGVTAFAVVGGGSIGACGLVIMAAVAPKSLLREVRSSPHCGSVRDQTSVMRSPTALAVRPIPWHMSIHDRDYLWTAHGHSCLVIMAAVAPKSLLREVRSSPHCGSVRDQTSVMRSPTALAVRPIPWQPIPWHMSIHDRDCPHCRGAICCIYIYSSCRLPQPPYVRPLRQPPRRRPP